MRPSDSFSEANLNLGCGSGCGPTVVADDVRLSASGTMAINDGALGDDVRISVRCPPGSVPCGGNAYFNRPTLIGDRLRLKSPGGIDFENGAVPLVIGDDAVLLTSSVSIDGGVVGFSIRFSLPSGFSVAAAP